MIPDDIIICRCGRIHFVRGKDYQEAIEADQELLLICGNCHATTALGADATEDGYSLYRRSNLPSVDPENGLWNPPDPFYKIDVSFGYPVPMTTGRFADSYFCGRLRDMAYMGEQSVDMEAFIKQTPRHILRLVSAYVSRNFDWSGTPYEHRYDDEIDTDSEDDEQEGCDYYD